MQVANRKIGSEYPPFIIAEAGINHKGNLQTAKRMVNSAILAGVDCIKFQTHIADKEMIPTHPLYEKIKKYQLSEKDEIKLHNYCKEYEIIFLSTPYCKEAVDRLEAMDVSAYKIGSGECNNTPLVEYIANKGKPVILSTGMNDIDSIMESIFILHDYECPFIVLQCVSMYPTPYSEMQLNRVTMFDGISDHSVGIYTALGAVALGAVAVEKHFDIGGDGPDAEVSLRQDELRELVIGSKAIWESLHGNNNDHVEEKVTSEWAFHSIVTTQDIKKGDELGNLNIGVKRAGKGGIPAKDYEKVVGKRAKRDLKANIQLKLEDIE